jgi:LysR family hydrogen peroxide-inducible transcriptional activator
MFVIDFINIIMNLQQIEYILALDKHKSFSKAAEACYITQATLSIMVKKLEKELDLVIFDRKTSPIITTDCGKDIIEEAKKIQLHVQKLKQIPSETKNKVEGELKIGVIPTIAGNLLHRILPVLIEKYPNLTLKIQEITTENIVRQIRSGLLDVGLLSTPIAEAEFEEEILYYEKLLVYGKLQNARATYLTPKDIGTEKIWLLEQGNCLSDQISNLCALSPKKMSSNVDFKPNSFESLINLVDKMHGLTLIPELYFNDLSEEKKQNVIDFQSPYPVREVSLIFHRPYAKQRLINALATEIKACVANDLQTSLLKNSEMIIAKMN